MEVFFPKPDTQGNFPSVTISPDFDSESARERVLSELEKVFAAMSPNVLIGLGCGSCESNRDNLGKPKAITHRLLKGGMSVKLRCPLAKKYIARAQQKPAIAQSRLPCSDGATVQVSIQQSSVAVPVESLTWSTLV